jgi:hypothetical protein
MPRVYKLEIAESGEDLKSLLRKQKTASEKERVQMVYLLKSGKAKTIESAVAVQGNLSLQSGRAERLYL